MPFKWVCFQAKSGHGFINSTASVNIHTPTDYQLYTCIGKLILTKCYMLIVEVSGNQVFLPKFES